MRPLRDYNLIIPCLMQSYIRSDRKSSLFSLCFEQVTASFPYIEEETNLANNVSTGVTMSFFTGNYKKINLTLASY